MSLLPLARRLKGIFIRRLFIPGIAVLFLGVSIWGWYEKSNIEEDQQYYAETVGMYVISYQRHIENDLSYVSELLRSPEGSFDSSIRKLVDASSLYRRLLVLTPEGKVWKSFPRGAEQSDFSGLIHLEQNNGVDLSGKAKITAPYYSSWSDSIVVAVTKPSAAGKIILVELELGEIQRYIENVNRRLHDGYAFLTDRYGNVIAHPDMELVSRQKNFGGLEIFSRQGKGGKGKMSSGLYHNDGTLELMSTASIPSSGWNAVVSRDAAGILSPILSTMLLGIAVILTLLGIIFYLIDYKINRIITKPISLFSHLVEDLRRGRGTSDAMMGKLRESDEWASFEELHSLKESFVAMHEAVILREQELRDSEEDLITTLHSIGDAVISTDVNGRIMRINPVAAELIGKEIREVVGSPLAEVFHIVNAETGESAEDPVRKVLENGKIVGMANGTVLVSADGTEHQIADSAAPIQDAKGEITGVVLVFRDVTERYRKDLELKKALEEKETLLREVHHRVKNNLNVVASLLSLQTDHVHSARDAKQALIDSRNRVYSMAIVHEDLYKSDNFTSVDMKSYLDALLSALGSAQNGMQTVHLRTEISDISLDITQAIPCGIIINELVTNALKYAFPDGTEGEVSVRLEPGSNNEYRLTVSDNGVGLPPDLELETSDSLGLHLVRTLTYQLQGELEVSSGEYTRFTIRFS